ncbi:MAG TPA: DoxX family protein [Chitinophagaceae bacterium]|nr:DoxX family protein [Chitinophagaceae bacterium]
MSRTNKIIYWVATGWLSLGMLSTGIAQLLHTKQGPSGTDSTDHLGYPLYFVTILAFSKILGVITILMPKFPLLKEWAYAGFVFIMCGAALSHVAMGDGMSDIFPSVLLLVLSLISWYYRPAGRKVILSPANK